MKGTTLGVCLFLLCVVACGLVRGQIVEDIGDNNRPRELTDKSHLSIDSNNPVPLVEESKNVKKEVSDLEKLKKYLKKNNVMHMILMASNLILSIAGIFLMSKMSRVSGKVPVEEPAPETQEVPVNLPDGFLENDDFERCED